ncbi:hypothetical protein MBLNU459_g7337t1 [Dothideomycetes sp. NU459]
MGSRRLVAAVTLLFLPLGLAQSSILECEQSLNGEPAFNGNTVPCIIGCGEGVTIATGSLLPGSINETETPYCQLDCVRKAATPAQSAAAPACSNTCQWQYKGTPENYAWCMYWCVDGLSGFVSSSTCVPMYEYVTSTVTLDGSVMTVPSIERCDSFVAGYGRSEYQFALKYGSFFEHDNYLSNGLEV